MFLAYLKGMFFLSISAEREDEQYILLRDVERHKKCPCIPSSLNTTAPRNIKQEQIHLFRERTSQVATTTVATTAGANPVLRW
jgi:hypothetical protein